MPKIFTRENRHHVPVAGLWLTNAVVQALVLTTYWSSDPYKQMLLFTSQMSLVPYLLVAMFGLMIIWRGETYGLNPWGRKRDFVFATGATAYGVFLVLASGLLPLVYSAILYASGTLLYMWARREQKLPIFTTREWIVFGLTCLFGLAGLIALMRKFVGD